MIWPITRPTWPLRRCPTRPSRAGEPASRPSISTPARCWWCREISPIAGPQQLGERTIGAPLGSDADTFARKLAAGDHTITLRSDYDTPAAVLADLRRGALDAAIVDNASALSDLGHQPGLKALGPALTLEPYVLACRLEAYQLHDTINHALDDLRNEGFFERLGKKWFVDAPLR